jgi:tetratricopeptide (TPR) repeat protein
MGKLTPTGRLAPFRYLFQRTVSRIFLHFSDWFHELLPGQASGFGAHLNERAAMSTESTNAPQVETPRPRTLSPLMFMIAAFMGLSVLLCAFVGALAFLEPEIPSSTALQEVVMPDGTILALEAVTWGKLHEYEIEIPSQEFEFFPGGRSRRINQGTSRDQTMLWFSRRDAITGKALDFDWWSHSTLLDSHGCEIRDSDNDARRHAHGSTGSGGRPFASISAGSRSERYTSIIATAGLPLFRHEGDTFTVRLYDLAGTKVGEFLIEDPSPIKGAYPVWEPEELPATKTNGDLTITLASVAGELNESERSRNGRKYIQKRTRLTYDFQVAEKGEPTSRWQSRSLMVSDALGNSLNNYDVSQLCEQEAAWKLTTKFYRVEKRENFDESELWTVKDVELPATNKTQYIHKKEKRLGVEFELIAAGGGGKKATYGGLIPKNSGSYETSSSVGKVPVEVNIESDHRMPGKLTVECELPHIVVNWTGQTSNNLIAQIDATDGLGRPVKLNGPYPGYGGNYPKVYILSRPEKSEVKDLIQKVSFTWSVQEAKEFEFLVKPPKAAPPKPRQRTPETPKRWLARAKRNIANGEKNLANNLGNSGGYYYNALAWAIVTAPKELRTPENIKKSVEYAQNAVEESRGSQAYGNTLAMALLRSGNSAEAVVKFKNNLASGLQNTMAVFDLYGLALAQFKNGVPDEARKTYNKAITRQKTRAPYIQRSTQWHDLYHLREELQTQFLGASPRDLIAQADELVAARNFEEAATVFENLLTIYDDDAWTWYRSATLQIYAGNEKSWISQCERMSKLFAESDDAYILERTGKVCLLAVAPDVTRIHAQGLIEKANALQPDSMWFVLARGLAQNRGKEYSKAVTSLENALTLKGRASSADVCIYSLLAMSHFRLDEQETATDSLTEAEAAFKKLPTAASGKLGDNWHDVLITEILLREARSLVQE